MGSKSFLKIFAGTVLEVTLREGKIQKSRNGARAEIHDARLSIIFDTNKTGIKEFLSPATQHQVTSGVSTVRETNWIMGEWKDDSKFRMRGYYPKSKIEVGDHIKISAMVCEDEHWTFIKLLKHIKAYQIQILER